MTISVTEVTKGVLAIIGESPSLAPSLLPGEESSVLNIADQVRALLLPVAIECTLDMPVEQSDELKISVPPATAIPGGWQLPLPQEFFRVVWVKMKDWDREERVGETTDDLRRRLRGRAPSWMTNPHRPVAILGHNGNYPVIEVYGSDSGMVDKICYEPAPYITSDDNLHIASRAYGKLPEKLAEKILNIQNLI